MYKKGLPSITIIFFGLMISVLFVLADSVELFNPVLSKLSGVGIKYQKEGYNMHQAVRDQIDFFGSLAEQRALNIELQQQKIELLSENERLLRELENQTLVEKQLQFDLAYELIAVRVISYVPTNPSEIIINKGTQQGITEGNTAILDNFLLGTVTEAREKTAKIQLVTSSENRIPGLIENRGVKAIVVGKDNNQIMVDEILITETIEIGDLVVTSGVNSTIPGGLILGTVTEIEMIGSELTKKAYLENPISFSKLDELFVIID